MLILPNIVIKVCYECIIFEEDDLQDLYVKKTIAYGCKGVFILRLQNFEDSGTSGIGMGWDGCTRQRRHVN